MIGAYARDSIVWVQGQGHDKYGEPLTPTETAVSARVVWKNRIVRDWRGEEAVSAAEIMMVGRPSPGDKIRIDGVDHAILAVREVKAYGRLDHHLVMIE